MNGAIVVAGRAQGVDVRPCHGLRRQRQDIGVGQQGALSSAQVRRRDRRGLQAADDRLAIVGANVLLDQNDTESRPVMVQSIVAVIER